MSAPGAYAARSGTDSGPAPRSGRHGSPPPHEAAADAALRSRTARLAALPALAVTLIAVAALVFVLRTTESGSDTAAGWWVTVGLAVIGCGVVTAAAAAGDAQARSTVRRYAALRRSAGRAQSDLQELLRRLEAGERIPPYTPPQQPRAEGDCLDLVAFEFSRTQRAAEAAVVQAAHAVRGESDNREKVEVFVNLARRLQSLVHREIELLDELENEVEDPDLLKGLFHVDHLATRIRRHAENLAVLGGAVSRRQWSRPVTLTEVLRSSIAEVEQYSRVKLVPPIEGTLRGHAVADVIHLLAELVENATLFSPPHTQVLLRAQRVSAGLAVEVEDRGLGMPGEEQERMNALLADPGRIDVGELLQDGRIGLFVVSALARRHGLAVQLRNNIYGGVQAVLVLPLALLGSDTTDPRGIPVTGAGEPPAVAPGVPAGTGGRQNGQTPAPLRGGSPAEGGERPVPPEMPREQREAGPAGGGPGPAHGSSRGPAHDVDRDGPPTMTLQPTPAARGAGYGHERDGRAPHPQPNAHTPPAPREGGARPAAPAGPATPPGGSPAVGSGPSGVRHHPGPPAEHAGGQPRPAGTGGGPGAHPPARTPAPPPALPQRAPHPGAPHPGAGPTRAAEPGPPAPRPTQPGGYPGEDFGGDFGDDFGGHGDRPVLPRRRRQEHLSPELRDSPGPRTVPADRGPQAEHDPELMAAFRRGFGLAEAPGAREEKGTDSTR
ncbi:ATP-binding protein [Streptomyces zingiberis]|uniref:histidine kinase n=1 Tax=Streptomyces zingiberis TaxID=2053010 RepID=A0ABX1BY87_9ACTN|nr:ATP-binding protein [Streptomyces zingiberis]NJQ02641.1 ATP-binding protein [Streptomyces zingiberis]